MPTYTFRNKKTGELTEEFMSISQRDEFVKKHKNLEPYIESAAAFSYSSAGDMSGTKTDNTWKEVMSKIAEHHPASALAERFGPNKSIKQVKTEQVIRKHIQKRNQK